MMTSPYTLTAPYIKSQLFYIGDTFLTDDVEMLTSPKVAVKNSVKIVEIRV